MGLAAWGSARGERPTSFTVINEVTLFEGGISRSRTSSPIFSLYHAVIRGWKVQAPFRIASTNLAVWRLTRWRARGRSSVRRRTGNVILPCKITQEGRSRTSRARISAFVYHRALVGDSCVLLRMVIYPSPLRLYPVFFGEPLLHRQNRTNITLVASCDEERTWAHWSCETS